MNVFALNAAPVNAAGVAAQYAFLPSTTAGMAIDLSERRSVSMTGASALAIGTAGQVSAVSQIGSGVMTLGLSATGQINAVAQIGSGTSALSIDNTGVLTRSSRVSIGTGSETLAINGVALLNSLTLVPAASSTLTLGATGALLRTGGLASAETITTTLIGDPLRTQVMGAASALTLNNTANLLRLVLLTSSETQVYSGYGVLSQGTRSYFPATTETLTWAAVDNLAATVYKVLPDTSDRLFFTETAVLTRLQRNYASGQVAWGTDATANLTSYVSLAAVTALGINGLATLQSLVSVGSTPAGMSLDLTGTLSNNSNVQDIDEHTMVRQPTDRTMMRMG